MLDNIRELQTIIENSNEEISIISQIITRIKRELSIDIVVADRKGVNLFNHKFNPDKYFFKIPLGAMSQKYGMIYANGIDSLNQQELEYFYSIIPVISLVLRNVYVRQENNVKRLISASRVVIGSLTATELRALRAVFAQLNTKGDTIVISNIANESGITRSVIVTALKKIESAGIIDSRSLGVGGTRISILNKYFETELNDH